MDNLYEISLLLDFYGQLLTKRQYEILDLHYNNDYSLGEIAQELKISRQGVFDNVKRGKSTLNELEEKLGLIKKFSEQKRKAEQVFEQIMSIEISQMPETDKLIIKKVSEGIKDIINAI